MQTKERILRADVGMMSKGVDRRNKPIVILLAMGLIGGMLGQAEAGDREWATAGKVLAGVVAGAVITDIIQDGRYRGGVYIDGGVSRCRETVRIVEPVPVVCPPPVVVERRVICPPQPVIIEYAPRACPPPVVVVPSRGYPRGYIDYPRVIHAQPRHGHGHGHGHGHSVDRRHFHPGPEYSYRR
jgi:hypothetical protein